MVSACSFSDTLPIKEKLPIFNAINVYDNPHTGKVILLVMNNSIYVGTEKFDNRLF